MSATVLDNCRLAKQRSLVFCCSAILSIGIIDGEAECNWDGAKEGHYDDDKCQLSVVHRARGRFQFHLGNDRQVVGGIRLRHVCPAELEVFRVGHPDVVNATSRLVTGHREAGILADKAP